MKKNLPTAIAPNKLPAVELVWPAPKKIREVTEELDAIVDYYRPLRETNDDLQEKASRMSDQSLQSAKRVLNRASSVLRGFSQGALEKEIETIDPNHWYDDNDNPNRSSVSIVLANLMGSFPTLNIPNPTAFTRLLLEDVMELAPSFPELEAACRKLRQSKKFIPTISEVLEAIKAERKAWHERYMAIELIECEHEEVTALLTAELKRREAEKQRREAVQKRRDEISAARALPICVGDRVRHPKAGNGTVAEIFPLEGLEERPECIVDFDKHGKHGVFVAASLERLAKCEEADAVPGEGNADNGVSRT